MTTGATPVRSRVWATTLPPTLFLALIWEMGSLRVWRGPPTPLTHRIGLFIKSTFSKTGFLTGVSTQLGVLPWVNRLLRGDPCQGRCPSGDAVSTSLAKLENPRCWGRGRGRQSLLCSESRSLCTKRSLVLPGQFKLTYKKYVLCAVKNLLSGSGKPPECWCLSPSPVEPQGRGGAVGVGGSCPQGHVGKGTVSTLARGQAGLPG